MELNSLNPEIKIEVSVEESTVIQPTAVNPPTNEIRKAMREEPSGTPVMYQTWRDILFLHWEWDPAEIQATLPPGLYVDTHGSTAYVGVTPFFMNDVRASFLPEIPGTSDFLELNVRTYVYDRNGVPGVWFYSLDCNNGLAAKLAKFFYSLPYHTAEMSAVVEGGHYRYRCKRLSEREESTFYYRKEERRVTSQLGSLPFFLTERYLLYSYSAKTGKLYTARVHHPPWELTHVQLGKFDATMLKINGLDPKVRAPELQWIASPVRVKVYPLEAT